MQQAHGWWLRTGCPARKGGRCHQTGRLSPPRLRSALAQLPRQRHELLRRERFRPSLEADCHLLLDAADRLRF